MKSALLFFISLIIYQSAFSQPSDIVVLKKGKHTLQTYFAGSYITFQTDMGFYSGKIILINKDSLFINQYDVRQIPTNLGVYVLDTIATYRLKFNYKEIISISNQKRKGFNWASSGGSLFGGGILITAVGLGTWLFTKPETQYHASPILVIGAAALGGIGYLLMKSNSSNYSIGKKYHLEYIKVK